MLKDIEEMYVLIPERLRHGEDRQRQDGYDFHWGNHGMPDHLPEVLDDVVIIEAYIQEWRRYHHTSGRGDMNTDARVTRTVIEEEEGEE